MERWGTEEDDFSILHCISKIHKIIPNVDFRIKLLFHILSGLIRIVDFAMIPELLIIKQSVQSVFR